MGWIKDKIKKDIGKNPNTKDEEAYVAQVQKDKVSSEGGYRQAKKTPWSDEYLCKIGDQWDLSIAPRDAKKKSKRPNICDNVVLPTTMNILDGLTASSPNAYVSGRGKEDKEVALKMSDLIAFILERNSFPQQWRNIVEQGIDHGPIIGFVPWDPEFMGGAGPNRWIGEVRTLCQNKDEIYFDPAIKDLEENLNDCRFIHQRYPKNLDYITDRWENGKYVTANLVEGEDTAEDFGYQRAIIIRSWHRGTPKFISTEDKEKYLASAEKATDKYEKQKYLDMASGTLKGIHCAYTAGTVFLEYTPYVYDDGLYPFAYAVLYRDEKNPYGFGEIKNIMSPQVAYNKCIEIEFASVASEGLGGGYYKTGAISRPQMQEINDSGYQAAKWHEVNAPDLMKPKENISASQNLIELKAFLKESVDNITQNNDIQKGISPGANVPYASVKELGDRGDTRNNGKMNILERFMLQFFRLMISRIGQFYTDEREYRIRGDKSQAIQNKIYEALKEIVKIEDKTKRTPKLIQLANVVETMNPNAVASYAKFSNTEMKKTWERTDDDGTKHEETYIAEYDVKVNLADERPTSRAYYERLAMQMFQFGAIGPKAFWTTIIEGTLPTVDEINDELTEIRQQKLEVEQQSKMQSPGIPQGNPAEIK